MVSLVVEKHGSECTQRVFVFVVQFTTVGSSMAMVVGHSQLCHLVPGHSFGSCTGFLDSQEVCSGRVFVGNHSYYFYTGV